MKEKIIHLQPPYPLQEDIENDIHRFRVVDTGRRFGKTDLAMREAFNMSVQGYSKTGKKQRGWIIAPTFPLVREDWLMAEELLKDAITSKHQTEMRMDISPFGFMEFKSAERGPDGLIGAGLNWAILDECKLISRESWTAGIRPALADKQGKALFISTPKGRNWFYEMYLQGQQENTEIKSWKYATIDGWRSLYKDKPSELEIFEKEWKEIERTTPDMIFRQEYMADFLEDEATVFKNISRCLRGSIETPYDEYYTIGIDLGKTEDFTVITVIRNSTCQITDIYRQNKIDWSLQKEFIRSVCSRYGRKYIAYIDSTGLGDPIEEDLRKSGVNTKDYKFTNQSKEHLISQLTIAIEQGLIGIPDCPQTQFLIDELKSFTYEILPSGKIRYSAPEGLHDDGVISLGLAVLGISHLLYKTNKKIEPVKQWGTADDWDKMYAEIDHEQKLKPWLNREQATEQRRLRFIRRAINTGAIR